MNDACQGTICIDSAGASEELPQSSASEFGIIDLQGEERMMKRLLDGVSLCWIPLEQMTQEIQEARHCNVSRRCHLLGWRKRVESAVSTIAPSVINTPPKASLP